ncbi:hypothetical protein KC968_02760 [Candidatus Saccharibacteria bacterium]|nr:hypothetical protein [Candidatus Saccharibacteria bacterium]
MSEQTGREYIFNILEAIEIGKGQYKLYFAHGNSGDLFATLRFHEPDETKFKANISRLFDKSVELGMLNNAKITIPDPAESENLDGVTFERVMNFGNTVSPEQARQALAVAFPSGEADLHQLEVLVLSQCIDQHQMPVVGVTFDGNNEIVTATPSEVAIEVQGLTEQYYRGDI